MSLLLLFLYHISYPDLLVILLVYFLTALNHLTHLSLPLLEMLVLPLQMKNLLLLLLLIVPMLYYLRATSKAAELASGA